VPVNERSHLEIAERSQLPLKEPRVSRKVSVRHRYIGQSVGLTWPTNEWLERQSLLFELGAQNRVHSAKSAHADGEQTNHFQLVLILSAQEGSDRPLHAIPGR
jgi:hypothetical protein